MLSLLLSILSLTFLSPTFTETLCLCPFTGRSPPCFSSPSLSECHEPSLVASCSFYSWATGNVRGHNGRINTSWSGLEGCRRQQSDLLPPLFSQLSFQAKGKITKGLITLSDILLYLLTTLLSQGMACTVYHTFWVVRFRLYLLKHCVTFHPHVRLLASDTLKTTTIANVLNS